MNRQTNWKRQEVKLENNGDSGRKQDLFQREERAEIASHGNNSQELPYQEQSHAGEEVGFARLERPWVKQPRLHD